jgi:hypothetical protein
MIRRLFIRQQGAPPAASAAGTAARRTRRRRPAFEPLEGRALLSFLGSEHRVSTQPINNFFSDNASSANGTSVAVWVNEVSITNHDIWAQRYDQAGHATGAPIRVDTLAAHDSYHPHVAMDAQGRFAVTWEDDNPADGTRSVLMRYFSAAGFALTAITPVTSAGSDDFAPDVAASNGSVVIAWTNQFSATDSDIVAERFVISGGVPHGQGAFVVNDDPNREDDPSVAMAPNGRFDIVYDRFNGSGGDIWASQYGTTGKLLRSNITILSSTASAFNPSVAMDNAGNAVVVYQWFAFTDYGIYSTRLSSGGAVGSVFYVRDDDGIDETNPSVALAPTGGQFVVAYETDNGVQVTEMDSNNAPLATLGPVGGFTPAISIDGFGRYLVTYDRLNEVTGHEDIFSRRDFLS